MMTKSDNLLMAFILPVWGEPRFIIRMDFFDSFNNKNMVFSFEREYFSSNSDKNYISLGYVKHGRYFKRIPIILKAFNVLINHIKFFRKVKFVYVFGFDCAFLAILMKKICLLDYKIIYEIADIRRIVMENTLKGKMVRYLEKLIIKNSQLVVTTSQAFVDNYINKKLKLTDFNYFVLENKLDDSLKEYNICKANWTGDSPLKIGCFGLMRYERSIQLLIDIAKKHPDKFVIIFRGYVIGENNNIKKILEEASLMPNVYWLGEYKSPCDLPNIYSEVDVSWVVYDWKASCEMHNIKWALANKLYESIYFSCPIIVRKDTEMEKRVINLGVGWGVDLEKPDRVEEFLLGLSPSLIFNAVEKCKKIKNRKDFFVIEDHKKLLEELYYIQAK